MGSARSAGVFDHQAIDTAVDGTASTVRAMSRFFLRIQTGRLQDYLAWMMVAAMLVFTLVWWLADWG